MDVEAARRSSHRGRRATPALAVFLVLATFAAALAAAGCGPATATASPSVSAPPSAAVPSATPLDDDDESTATLAPGASFSPGPTGEPLPSSASGATADRLPGEPDPLRTPGVLNPAVTQADIGSTICVSGWTATIRPPSSYTTNLKKQQIVEYGYTDTSTADYEEDHLISLELGGAPTDPRNLWPEPYTAGLSDGRSTSAHIKDGFETQLKKQVCAGSLTLAAAQAEIGDHWVHAFYGIAFTTATNSAGPSASAGGPSAGPSSSAGPTALPAALSVKITSLSASVKHGSNATVTAVTVAGSVCTASVTDPSGTISSASGLKPARTVPSTGKVSWTWKVGSSTDPGVATVTIECSHGAASGSAVGTFKIT
jgi:hypothetical protein